MSGEFNLGKTPVGSGQPAYLVAEMSANHGHDLRRALELVRAAAAAGADAVKVQTYTPDTLTIDCDGPEFRLGEGSLWAGRTLYELYGEAYMPWEWHEPLREEAVSDGLDFFSTPFDASAVTFLEELGVPAFKIASFELVDLQLLREVAATGKPVILSTGMATVTEIEEALLTLRDNGAVDIVLLRCNSGYPALPEEMDLRSIPDMASRFGVPIGLSDHTLGTTVPILSVALGACLIEKHFTLSRDDGGPDAAFSLEPAEFRSLVDAVRLAERALGEVRYGPSAREEQSLVFRRSLFVVTDVKAGEPFSDDNVRSIRPGAGLHTRHLPEIIGRRAARDIARGTPVSWELIAP